MMNSELKVESTFGMGSKKDGLNIDTPVVVLTANAIKGVKEEYSEIGSMMYASNQLLNKNLFQLL